MGDLKVAPAVNYNFPLLVFSRPGQSQDLLYKNCSNSFNNSLGDPFPPLALRRRQAQTV